MVEFVLDRYIYLLVVVLLAIGLWGILVPSNLIKKLLGMVIFQTAIYLFFIEGSVVDGGTAPIIEESIGTDAALYVNPLPHLLILTAIVVGVGVLGVGFALSMQIHRAYGTLEEHRIIDLLAGDGPSGDPVPTDPSTSEASPGDGGGDPDDGRSHGGDG